MSQKIAYVPVGIYKKQICEILEEIEKIKNCGEGGTGVNQTISLVGNNLILSDGGGTVNLTKYLDDQIITNFSLTGTELSITIADGNTKVVDLQSLEIVSNRSEVILGSSIGWVEIAHNLGKAEVHVTSYISNEPNIVDWRLLSNLSLEVRAFGANQIYKILISK